MIKRNLKWIADACHGSLNKNEYKNLEILGVSNDTRKLEKDNLYIAIVGQNFDGHKFLDKAIEAGASAALWNKNLPYEDIDFPLILVDDTLKAFQEIAKAYRMEVNPKIIAITGSNGKTTTKDILTAVVSTKYKTHNNKGNQNNEIGVPLTLLSMPEDTEVAIIEMGTERFGEIIVLTEMAKPDISMITNIGDSHLEELLTKENIAKEKLDIVKGMNGEGIFIYNLDDEILAKVVPSTKIDNRILTIGQNKKSNYLISDISLSKDKTVFSVNGKIYTIDLVGKHQVYNATIAIAISELLSIDGDKIIEGFKNIKSTGMRNELKHFGKLTILDDSYKSNPQNLISALDMMALLDGYSKKFAALADMLGLGENSREIHIQTAKKIDEYGLDGIYLFGEEMKEAYEYLKENGKTKTFWFENKEELSKELIKNIDASSIVLVKGSRYMKMETVVSKLKENFE